VAFGAARKAMPISSISVLSRSLERATQSCCDLHYVILQALQSGWIELNHAVQHSLARGFEQHGQCSRNRLAVIKPHLQRGQGR
jgi:hypothetical protein